MGQSSAVMVSEGSQEDLRFMLQPAEGFAVDDAVSVSLKISP
jgi:hypothetical protein